MTTTKPRKKTYNRKYRAMDFIAQLLKVNKAHAYDVATGLRSPDQDLPTFKKLVTCVIRGEENLALGIESAYVTLKLYNDEELAERICSELKETKDHWSHFLNHSQAALEAINRYYHIENLRDYFSRTLYDPLNRNVWSLYIKELRTLLFKEKKKEGEIRCIMTS